MRHFSVHVWFLFLSIGFIEDGLSIDPHRICEGTGNKYEIKAFTKWPFRIDCKELIKYWEQDQRHGVDDSYECYIGNKGTGMYGTENIYIHTSSNESTTYYLHLIINGATCINSTVEVKLEEFPKETCNHFQEDSLLEGQTRFYSGTMDGSMTLRCITPDGFPTVMPEGVNRRDFKTRWTLDCGVHDVDGENGALRNNGHYEKDPDGYPDQLMLHSIDFYDAGNFTCEVTYQGRTLRVVTTEVCIKQNAQFSKPTLTCTKEELEEKGKPVLMKCSGQIVIGQVKSGDLRVVWKRKNGNALCSNEIYNRTEYGKHRGHSCMMNGDNSTIECLKHIDEHTVIQKPRRVVAIEFKIDKLEKDDFGEYVVELRYRDAEPATWSIVLKEDLTSFYAKIVKILSSVLSVLAFLVIVALLIKYFALYIYVLSFYKRSCLWKYDRDDKKYVAYLSYFFDTAMNENSRKATEVIVFAFQDKLAEMDYNFYDEHREGHFTIVVEQITNLVENCHRMVLVITPEYLDDKWMRFHAELGFYGLLESRMGLIFVLTPGAKKLLKKRARKDKVWRKVLIAVKTNQVINWKPTMGSDKLKRFVEYYMPKLDRNRRLLATTCSMDETGREIARSMSQNTQVSTLGDFDNMYPDAAEFHPAENQA